jgi:hypothetical protein
MPLSLPIALFLAMATMDDKVILLIYKFLLEKVRFVQ